MADIIQLDEDLSPAISALAHSLSAEIGDDNVPSDKFENVANILLNGLLDFPKIKSKLSSLLSDGSVCIWDNNSDQMQILYHATSSPDAGMPHDHGTSWALYFQVSGVTQMTMYKDAAGNNPANKAERVILNETIQMRPGIGIYFPPGSVHSAAHPTAPASWIRLTGQDLSKLSRRAFDQETGLRI
jgi:mannose-6-phosphate isomerase-like protein (cupin superfamily)